MNTQSKNLAAAIATLNELAKSSSKLTKRGANNYLAVLATAKRLSQKMANQIEQLQTADAKRVAKNEQLKKKRNTAKVTEAVQTGVIVELLERSANVEAPSRAEAYATMSKNVCLISYELVNTSKTTGELKGSHTIRFATRMRELYSTTKASGEAIEDDLIRYHSLKDTTKSNSWRACSDWYFKGLIELPKNITNLFKRSTPELRAYYANVAEAAIRERRKVIEGKTLGIKLAS